MLDLIDGNNGLKLWMSSATKMHGCLATADHPWLLLFNSVCEINKHPLSSTPTLPSRLSLSIPSPLSRHHLLSGARSSHQLWWGLRGGLCWIAGELKEAGWLQQPSFTSLFPPRLPNGIRLSGLHLAAPRWRVFCSPCAPVICPLPAPALPWKITFWGETIIILAAPMHPEPVSSY